MEVLPYALVLCAVLLLGILGIQVKQWVTPSNEQQQAARRLQERLLTIADRVDRLLGVGEAVFLTRGLRSAGGGGGEVGGLISSLVQGLRNGGKSAEQGAGD